MDLVVGPGDEMRGGQRRTHHRLLERASLKFVMTEWASEDSRPHLCGLLTVALGKGIKLLSLPHIHLPPTIAPIEPGSLGEPH